LENECPAEKRPVCGSDGQNYPNTCVLTARACLMRKDVIAEYDGPCGTITFKGFTAWQIILFFANKQFSRFSTTTM